MVIFSNALHNKLQLQKLQYCPLFQYRLSQYEEVPFVSRVLVAKEEFIYLQIIGP